jgi:hypothetical protein
VGRGQREGMGTLHAPQLLDLPQHLERRRRRGGPPPQLPRQRAPQPLPGRFRPQYFVINRRGIGKSQSKWTASKMETPGSPRRRPSAPAPCATAGDGTAARHSVRPIESPWLGRARRAAPWQLHAQHGDSMAGRHSSPAGTPSRTAAPRGSGCGACPAVSILSTS